MSAEENAHDVRNLAPVKFWGVPEMYVTLDFGAGDAEALYAQIRAQFAIAPIFVTAPAPAPTDAIVFVTSETSRFEMTHPIDCIERFTNFCDRAPLLEHIKNGDLNTDQMRKFFSSLVLGEVSAPVGNPAAFEQHKKDLRIARFVAVLIAYGGQRTKVYNLAARRFRANKHHIYSHEHIYRIYKAHRDEAWGTVVVIKGLFKAMEDKGLIASHLLASFIDPFIKGAAQITEEDIRSTSAKTVRQKR
jgi:hypothetical protein